jgi:hypothetical protein
VAVVTCTGVSSASVQTSNLIASVCATQPQTKPALWSTIDAQRGHKTIPETDCIEFASTLRKFVPLVPIHSQIKPLHASLYYFVNVRVNVIIRSSREGISQYYSD